MGLNQFTKTPCGFCFVEYYTHEHMAACVKLLSLTICDDRLIRVDADGGFKAGRQFGRGKSGGQVRDERRQDIDVSRGTVIIETQLHSNLGKRGRGGDNNDGYEQNDSRMVEGRDGFGRDFADNHKRRVDAPLSHSRF